MGRARQVRSLQCIIRPRTHPSPRLQRGRRCVLHRCRCHLWCDRRRGSSRRLGVQRCLGNLHGGMCYHHNNGPNPISGLLVPGLVVTVSVCLFLPHPTHLTAALIVHSSTYSRWNWLLLIVPSSRQWYPVLVDYYIMSTRSRHVPM